MPARTAKGRLEICRGIEVGHIFQLRTKYSEAMECTYLDKDGKTQVMEMAATALAFAYCRRAIEQNFDQRGIVFPQAMAPFALAIVPVGYHRSEQVKAEADKLYAELRRCRHRRAAGRPRRAPGRNVCRYGTDRHPASASPLANAA